MFAPVVKYKTLRVLLSLCVVWDYEVDHMDVETAFLNVPIDEDLYIKMPQGVNITLTPEKGHNKQQQLVCKLNKALYGTKQAPHQWNEELNSCITGQLGFKRCSSDTCVYVRTSKTGRPMLLSVIVDDLLPMYHPDDAEEWAGYRRSMMERYTMKKLGAVAWLLGMRVTRDRQRKTIH